MTFLQVYQGLVYMDFNKQLMDKQGYGTDPASAYYFITVLDSDYIWL